MFRRILRFCLIAVSDEGSGEGNGGSHAMFSTPLALLIPSKQKQKSEAGKACILEPIIRVYSDARYCFTIPTLVYLESEIAKGYLRPLSRMSEARSEVPLASL